DFSATRSVILYLLFCPSYAQLLYPHTFPTRRSSDLGIRRRREEGHAQGREHRRRVRGPDRRIRRDPVCPQGRLKRSRKKPPHGRDRKSTRLNSSHVKISYAVFCLKKKTILQVKI